MQMHREPLMQGSIVRCMNDENMDAMVGVDCSQSWFLSYIAIQPKTKTHTNMDQTSDSPPFCPMQVTDSTSLTLPTTAPTLPGI